jgi:hypothetical protein
MELLVEEHPDEVDREGRRDDLIVGDAGTPTKSIAKDDETTSSSATRCSLASVAGGPGGESACASTPGTPHATTPTITNALATRPTRPPSIAAAATG